MGQVACEAWVLSRTREAAEHPTSPHKPRLDPFSMLSFSLVTKTDPGIDTGPAWCGTLT